MPVAVAALVVGVGCHHQVSAATELSQAEAESISSNIYIAECHPPQSGLTRTVVRGTPDPNGHIREQYGPVLVYPVQVTWTGSCIAHPMGPQQTDVYDHIQARYTSNYFKDQFGNWSHTPFVGTCSWIHESYQPQGSAPIPVPGAHPEGCTTADMVNDR